MNRVMLGGFVAVCVGFGVYSLVGNKRLPTPNVPPAALPIAVVPPPPAPPAMLPNVIELADLDPLLDPPARPATGAPFDGNVIPVNAATPAPDRIPLAVE